MPGLITYPTPAAQKERLEQLGWNNVQLQTIHSWFSSKPEHTEKGFVAKVDEYEEFALLTQHYFISSATHWAV